MKEFMPRAVCMPTAACHPPGMDAVMTSCGVLPVRHYWVDKCLRDHVLLEPP